MKALLLVLMNALGSVSAFAEGQNAGGEGLCMQDRILSSLDAAADQEVKVEEGLQQEN